MNVKTSQRIVLVGLVLILIGALLLGWGLFKTSTSNIPVPHSVVTPETYGAPLHV